MRQAETGLEKETEAWQSAKSQHALCEGEAQELEGRMGQVEGLHLESKESRNKLKTHLRQLKRNIQQDTTKLQEREGDAADYRARIDEEKKRDQEEIAAERQTRLDEIAQREDEMMRLNLESQELMEKDDKIRDDITQIKEAMASNRSEEKEAKTQLETLKRRLSSLEAGRKNRLKLYGQHVPHIIAEIERAHQQRRFHRKPKGPLGAFMTVRDPKTWCLAIERCLGGLLYSFCCHDGHDTKILREILNTVVPKDGWMPSILTSPFEGERYDVSRNKVRCNEHPSLLDLVQIDDPVIFNNIIDRRGVEQILFIRDKETAKHLLKHSPPMNCQEAYTMDGDQIYAGWEQRYYSCPKNKKARLLQKNISDVIREFRREIDEQTLAIDAMSGQADELKRQLREKEGRQTELSRCKKELASRMSSIQTELNTLKEEENTEVSAIMIGDLEHELTECLDQVSNLRRSLGRLNEQYQTGQVQAQRMEQECQKIDREMDELSAQIDPLKEKLVAVSMDVETRRVNMEHYSQKRDDLIKNRDTMIKERDNREKEIDEAMEKARRICEERVECERTPQSVDSEIHEITKRIEKEQRRHGDPVELKENYDRAKESYLLKTRYINKMDRFVKDLDKSMDMRQKAFIRFRRSIAHRTRLEFIGYMSRRGFSAQLLLDHQREELHIKIDVNPEKNKDSETSSLLQLSGGEKSFSTVCLLMALWNSVESPFLAMDEFDVCMDMVNRRITLDSLMWYGEHNKKNQFLFISPLDMSVIQSSPSLTNHQLQPPTR